MHRRFPLLLPCLRRARCMTSCACPLLFLSLVTYAPGADLLRRWLLALRPRVASCTPRVEFCRSRARVSFGMTSSTSRALRADGRTPHSAPSLRSLRCIHFPITLFCCFSISGLANCLRAGTRSPWRRTFMAWVGRHASCIHPYCPSGLGLHPAGHRSAFGSRRRTEDVGAVPVRGMC